VNGSPVLEALSWGLSIGRRPLRRSPTRRIARVLPDAQDETV
jgi:hypothetical protein